MTKMDRGTLSHVSGRHKLNVESFTESELVSIADVVEIMIWSKYFMKVQGSTIKK